MSAVHDCNLLHYHSQRVRGDLALGQGNVETGGEQYAGNDSPSAVFENNNRSNSALFKLSAFGQLPLTAGPLRRLLNSIIGTDRKGYCCDCT